MFQINRIFFYLILIIQNCTFGKIDQMTLGHCLKQQPNNNAGLISCIGQQAIESLKSIDETENYTLTNGLTMIKDQHAGRTFNSDGSSFMSRSIPNFLDQDPMDFKGILENAGAIIGQRTIQWELDMIHPGLCLRIGPSADSSSILEFIMDPSLDRDDRIINEEKSTARTLAKHFVIPFLLGLKFNLVTVLPLIFAGIILLCKKAAILGKFALFLTGLMGFGGLFSLAGFGFGGGSSNIGSNYKPYGSGLGSYGGLNDLSSGYYKIQEQNFPRMLTESSSTINEQKIKPSSTKSSLQLNEMESVDNFYNYEKKVLMQDRNSKLYERDYLNDGYNPFTEQGYRDYGWKTIG